MRNLLIKVQSWRRTRSFLLSNPLSFLPREDDIENAVNFPIRRLCSRAERKRLSALLSSSIPWRTAQREHLGCVKACPSELSSGMHDPFPLSIHREALFTKESFRLGQLHCMLMMVKQVCRFRLTVQPALQVAGHRRRAGRRRRHHLQRDGLGRWDWDGKLPAHPFR